MAALTAAVVAFAAAVSTLVATDPAEDTFAPGPAAVPDRFTTVPAEAERWATVPTEADLFATVPDRDERFATVPAEVDRWATVPAVVDRRATVPAEAGVAVDDFTDGRLALASLAVVLRTVADFFVAVVRFSAVVVRESGADEAFRTVVGRVAVRLAEAFVCAVVPPPRVTDVPPEDAVVVRVAVLTAPFAAGRVVTDFRAAGRVALGFFAAVLMTGRGDPVFPATVFGT
ncbi:hypothetical protein [Kineosporia mesophila]|uniref:hypothetical protein n=1 Tax=Kineosporia mesophila TaxID=566012 RepID=UPI001E30A47A|nr:hypothetical protein [Kineosporia mesophila]MCD5353354.1 hypothetical protein [Kineosporia mesophila]